MQLEIKVQENSSVKHIVLKVSYFLVTYFSLFLKVIYWNCNVLRSVLFDIKAVTVTYFRIIIFGTKKRNVCSHQYKASNISWAFAEICILSTKIKPPLVSYFPVLYFIDHDLATSSDLYLEFKLNRPTFSAL